MQHIQAILFDKDGTLFDFQATWGAWARRILGELAEGDPEREARLAEAIAFDRVTGLFRPESAVIAGTSREVAELIVPHLADQTGGLPALSARLAAAAAEAPLAEAVPLAALLSRLGNAGYLLGVATNDNEAVARRQIAPHLERFDFVAGFDSGHGGKPAPGMLLAFARQVRVPPEAVLMVGDSRHDLVAGRAAGMSTMGVLTGVATEADLAPLADVVRPDIGHLPALLGLDDRRA